MRQYDRALTKSARAFRNHIVPILKQKLKLDKIISCEDKNSATKRDLDYKHCIDYQLFKGGRICGLANRILFRAELNHKITLRKSRSDGTPTEHEKIKSAIENGGIYPELFCVSCIVANSVKSCALIRTADLMKFIEETNPPTRTNTDHDKNQTQEYFCFDWRDMLQCGYNVWILVDCA